MSKVEAHFCPWTNPTNTGSRAFVYSGAICIPDESPSLIKTVFIFPFTALRNPQNKYSGGMILVPSLNTGLLSITSRILKWLCPWFLALLWPKQLSRYIPDEYIIYKYIEVLQSEHHFCSCCWSSSEGPGYCYAGCPFQLIKGYLASLKCGLGPPDQCPICKNRSNNHGVQPVHNEWCESSYLFTCYFYTSRAFYGLFWFHFSAVNFMLIPCL